MEFKRNLRESFLLLCWSVAILPTIKEKTMREPIMNFICQSLYRQKELTALSRAMRKTVRRKSDRNIQVLEWGSIALGIAVVLTTKQTWVRWLDSAAILLLLVVLVWGDAINGFAARMMVPKGEETVTISFSPEGYTVESGASVTQWSYEQVLALAETQDYILLVQGPKEGEICKKAALQGGTLEEFRNFLQEKTHKNILNVGR